jgi:hypothetical protein
MNNDKQHREDTKYKQWEDGMYVMLDDLDCDYELALVEDSLRDSVYYTMDEYFGVTFPIDCFGVLGLEAGLWRFTLTILLSTKLTRAQALYIATGDVNI